MGAGAIIFWTITVIFAVSLVWLAYEYITSPLGEEIPGRGLVLQDSDDATSPARRGDRATPGTFADQELCPVATDLNLLHSTEVNDD